jgi:hypothetical protein
MDSHFVSFITVEDGTDLIVSFAVTDSEDGSYQDCLNIIRTPKYEQFLEPHERCPMVSFPLEDQGAERRPLKLASYSAEDGVISIRCDGITFALDLSRVEPEDFDAMVEILRKMCKNSNSVLTGL